MRLAGAGLKVGHVGSPRWTEATGGRALPRVSRLVTAVRSADTYQPSVCVRREGPGLPLLSLREMSPTKTRPRRSQRERREATTAKLLATARRLFARDGYTATSVEAIVRAAGMTKGAFFHHFSDKADVFAAVYEEEERKLGEAMTAAFLKKKDPWAGFSAGSKAFLEAAFDAGVQQIMLVDAPSVLGLERMRHIQGTHTFALMSEGL